MPTRKRSLIGAGLAAAVAACTVIAPSASATAATPTDLGPRLERACLRIPNLEIRTGNLIERLQGDATVRGSLAWLQVQIDKAEQRGRTDLAEVLRNRLAVREQTLDVLQLRLDVIPALKAFCVEHGVEL